MTDKTLTKSNRQWYIEGLKVGIPIGLGYFAVAFALGITAKNAGMSAFQSGVMCALMMASAGQYAAMTIIATGGSLLEMALTTLIVNLRYILMGCALSQKVPQDLPMGHRFGIAQTITDEMFGAAISLEGKLNPFFNYGMISVSMPGWTLGCVLGNVAGNILPERVSNALGVALYGMFLATIIPAAKKNRIIAAVVVASMALSCGFSYLPAVKGISSGMQIIILTVIIAGAAALIKPVDTKEEAP